MQVVIERLARPVGRGLADEQPAEANGDADGEDGSDLPADEHGQHDGGGNGDQDDLFQDAADLAEGKPIDNRTAAQKASLAGLLGVLRKKYPTATIQGHRDFSPDRNRNGRIEPSEYIKACPCFDAKAEYKDI